MNSISAETKVAIFRRKKKQKQENMRNAVLGQIKISDRDRGNQHIPERNAARSVMGEAHFL